MTLWSSDRQRGSVIRHVTKKEACYSCTALHLPSAFARQQLANYFHPNPAALLHAHLVDVHGGAGPAQAPELGDHGGGLGGGGHGGGTRPSGQPLVTALLDSPGWSDVGGIEAPMGRRAAVVDPRGCAATTLVATPSHHTIDGGRAVGGC